MMERPVPISREVIARPEDYSPSHPNLKVIGTPNPGATIIKNGDGLERILLMVRVTEKYYGDERRHVHLPYYHVPNEDGHPLMVDFDIHPIKRFYHISSKGRVRVNKKEVTFPNGRNRLRHISHPKIMVLDMNGNILERRQEAALTPMSEVDRFGMEDVRITSIEDGPYIITYTGPHRKETVSTTILETYDFKHFEQVQKDNTARQTAFGKDMAVFPRECESPSTTRTITKGQNMYTTYIRPDHHQSLSPPGIGVAFSTDFVHWGQFHRLTEEERTTGTGAPPILRNGDWVAPYHEIHENRIKKFLIFNKKENEYKTYLMRSNGKKPWEGYITSGVLLEREDYRDLLPEDGFIDPTLYTSAMVEWDGISTLFSGIGDKWTGMDKFYSEDLDVYIRGSQ